MFEPQPFDTTSSGQDALMAALQRRDMKAFKMALEDPEVDPNHWYGKPYWTTCLQLAAKTEGCEAFVLALLRAGAGDSRSRVRPRPSDTGRSAAERVAKFIAEGGQLGMGVGDGPNADLDTYLDLLDVFESLAAPAGACVCGAQSLAASAGAAGAAEERPVNGAATEPTAAGFAGGGAGGARSEQLLGLWLREMSRALRETADVTRRELRGLAERVEQLGERVAGVERAQQRTADILAHLASHDGS